MALYFQTYVHYCVNTVMFLKLMLLDAANMYNMSRGKLFLCFLLIFTHTDNCFHMSLGIMLMPKALHYFQHLQNDSADSPNDRI